MPRTIAVMMFLAFALFCTPQVSAEEELSLLVRVEGIRSKLKGEVGVALFESQRGYPTHLQHAYEAEWVPLKGNEKFVEVLFDTMGPGEFAISVVHDTNDNRLVDRSRLGFPKEGVGFSEGQRVTLRAPRFKKAKFPLAEGEHKQIVIKLHYRD